MSDQPEVVELPPTPHQKVVLSPKEWVAWFVTHENLHHIVIVGGVWIGSAVVALSLVVDAGNNIETWGKLHDPTITLDCLKTCQATHAGAELACERVSEQVTEVLGRASHHYAILNFYSAQQFAMATAGYTIGILTAILAVIISRTGWGDCDRRILTAFIASAAATAFYEGYPTLARFQENIDGNQVLYLEYDNLADELRTFCLVGDGLADIQDPAMFALYIDAKLRSLNQVHFSVDESQVGLGRSKFLDAQDLESYRPTKDSDVVESTPSDEVPQ